MMWMFVGHLLGWWLMPEYSRINSIIYAIVDAIGASMFIFLSGMSTIISYRNRCNKAATLDDYSMKTARNEYFIRALLILLIALIYNTCVAIGTNDLTWIWSWFFLFTIAISLLISWPLLKTPIYFRILICAFVWSLHIYLLDLLTPFRGEENLYGVLYHLFYHPIDLAPFFVFFPFFLIGTVIGDLIAELIIKDNQIERRIYIKNKLLVPSIIIGIGLIIFGILLQFPDQHPLIVRGFLREFPSFLVRSTLSWIIYTMGIMLTLFSFLLTIEVFEIIKTEKSYKFLFYFSYYSFTVYLAHNIMYFLFLKQLSIYNIWFFIIGSIILWEFGLRAVYNSKWRNNISIKFFIAKTSQKILENLAEKKKNPPNKNL